MRKARKNQVCVGEIYNRLTVVSLLGTNILMPGAGHYVSCLCTCGRETKTREIHLKNGHTKSCGCILKEVQKRIHTTHGLKYTVEYVAFANMMSRCYSLYNPEYHHYGGRGITVCLEWYNNPTQFVKDMGLKPAPELTLERLNNNLGYSPDNCIWDTMSNNLKNRRSWKVYHP